MFDGRVLGYRRRAVTPSAPTNFCCRVINYIWLCGSETWFLYLQVYQDLKLLAIVWIRHAVYTLKVFQNLADRVFWLTRWTARGTGGGEERKRRWPWWGEGIFELLNVWPGLGLSLDFVQEWLDWRSEERCWGDRRCSKVTQWPSSMPPVATLSHCAHPSFKSMRYKGNIDFWIRKHCIFQGKVTKPSN